VSDPAFETRWRRRFEAFAKSNDDDAGIAGWSDSGLQARLRNFKRAWRQPDDGHGPSEWLDVGCGAGSYARYLVEHGSTVVGVDYSHPTLVKAIARGKSSAICWLAGDATRLPIRTGAFDGALCFGVLQALSGPEPVIRELARCVRSGGEIWIDALNARCGPTLVQAALARWKGTPSRLRYDVPGRLVQTLERAGLAVVRLYWVPILPGKLHRLQPLIETRAFRGLLEALPWLATLVSHAFVIQARRSGPFRDE